MQNILVCQTGGWIGDMVLLTPALRALKNAYPESNLSLLLRPLVADLMATHPYVDTCIVDPKNRGRYRSLTGLVRRIHGAAFDAAVVLHPTSLRNALLPFLARVPIRVGTNVSGRGMLLTASCEDDTSVHEVHRYLRVLRLLTIDGSPDFLEFWHTDADRDAIQDLLHAEGVSSTDRLIAFNLGTTWRTKRWAIANFVEVIDRIARRTPDTSVVLTGSLAETELAAALPASLPAINLVGKTSILQLGALLERCEICLTCDSGSMHIAAAVGTPTIALFGPTDPVRHKPYGAGHTIIEKPVVCRPCYKRTCHRQDALHLCLTEIAPAEVVKVLELKLHREASAA
ncbi:lipopolysaccharide heptosyltransferase II [Candidatus Poribacteria bacterium]|nr:lipopolysaccharide heptosyltransferase II [Candidatus Poribacteria bacterium]MYH82349.1 lipopolysaccharide heptosyltransferase II [Candidatus Poribacteria bacterium]MYK94825.1 lipopolysaccharide heptosyltransferase II [Candidatus Poribacteria bacterium]